MTIAPAFVETRAVAAPRRLYAEWSLLRRAWEGLGCALVAGGVTGYALGTDLRLYLATAGIASIAGLPAATQHRTLRGALLRTTGGGFAWAVAVLVVFLVRGHEAVARVPDPIGLYLVFATLPATAVGWAVWTWTNRDSVASRTDEVSVRR